MAEMLKSLLERYTQTIHFRGVIMKSPAWTRAEGQSKSGGLTA